jgi:hypothetical protein
VAGDIPLGAGAVGALDRVDPKLEVAPAMEDATGDDSFDEVGVA